MANRRALAAVAACGEATKPGLAPIGSLNQHSALRERVKVKSVFALLRYRLDFNRYTN